jgi:hypothetical protein
MVRQPSAGSQVEGSVSPVPAAKAVQNDFQSLWRQVVGREVFPADEGDGFRVRSGLRLSSDVFAQIVDDHVVVQDAALVPVYAVEDRQHLEGRHLETRLFTDFPHHGLFEGLAELDRPARNQPSTTEWLLAPPDQKHPPVPDDDGADPYGGPLRLRPMRQEWASPAATAGGGGSPRRRKSPAASPIGPARV